ncbi:hypothetical protein SK128_006071 [Halocaridina rubra]|uniref:Ionotropic glutamate receptor L-glutamate and glycine-binding domain-containing protein n=1 Tax=Halocaridina rubra TaxID=373956 RepID=A0AAN8XHF8_HALRR
MNLTLNSTSNCLRLGINTWMPHIFILKHTKPYVMVGSMVEIMKIITDKLDVCWEWILANDLKFGIELPNKTWSGLIGQLTRNEIDVTAAPLTMSDSRSKVIDFSVPLYIDVQAIAHKAPGLESDILGFIKPYSYLSSRHSEQQCLVSLYVDLLSSTKYV